MQLHAFLPLLALLASQANLVAQSSGPPRRAHHSLIYDEASRRIILSGGSTPVDSGSNAIFYNDLWAFDGRAWTKLGEAGEKMSGSALVFDPQSARVLSFGGYNGRALGVMRQLSGSEWRVVGTHPELVVAEAGAVFDRARGRLMTFGGSFGPRRASDATWTWDGTEWSRLLGTAPPARQAFAMVYDERRAKTVIFGGLGIEPSTQGPPVLGDAWEFDGTSWTQRSETGPSPRASPGATYDSKRGRIILFGGIGKTGMLGDTWSWDGASWSKLAETGPSPRAMGYLAYDRARDRVVLFGGRVGWPNEMDDTWELDATGETPVWRRVPNP